MDTNNAILSKRLTEIAGAETQKTPVVTHVAGQGTRTVTGSAGATPV